MKWAVTSGKRNDKFVANDRMGALKWKLEFGKLAFATRNMTASQDLKDFSNESDGDINKSDFFLLL